MVLKNHADRKTGENKSGKAYKIKGKRLESIGKGYHDLSSNNGHFVVKSSKIKGFTTFIFVREMEMRLRFLCFPYIPQNGNFVEVSG